MESIKELREICQSTRPSIFSDPISGFYYKISIYFTWICILVGMSANQVTVLSGVVAIIGGYLLSNESPMIVLIGALCFHIFAILDMSDGEVARYKKQTGVQGHYLDWFMHFITPTALVIGLFLGSLENFHNSLLITIGLIAVVIPVMSKSVQNAGWTVIVWTLLRNKKLKNFDLIEITSKEKKPKEHSKPYKIARLILISPFEDRWSSVLILFLSALDLFLYYFDFFRIDYRFIWVIYMGTVGPAYIYLKVREMLIYPSLKEGYNKLIDKGYEVVLPQDDFL